jgi:replication factor A1
MPPGVTQQPYDEVAALRAWYDAEGATAETTAAGAGLASARGPGGGGNIAQRTTLAAMQPELLAPATDNPEVGLVCATAVLIKADQPMYYTACPEVGLFNKLNADVL